jgi:hypothetical protein
MSKNCKSTFFLSKHLLVPHLINFLNVMFFMEMVAAYVNSTHLMKGNK